MNYNFEDGMICIWSLQQNIKDEYVIVNDELTSGKKYHVFIRLCQTADRSHISPLGSMLVLPLDTMNQSNM